MTSEAESTDPGPLRAAEVAVDAWCSGLDPALLTGPQAAEVATRAAAMIRKLTASQVRLAGRVDETRAFTATHRDAAGWLAATTGSSVGDASRMLRTGERLADCPTTREAFEAGALSLAEAEVVSQAAKADPSAEPELVRLATRRHNLHGLREQADRVRRGAHRAEDEAARAAAIRASRRWIESNDTVDGAPRIDAKFVPQDHAAAKQVLARFQQRIYDETSSSTTTGAPAPATLFGDDAVGDDGESAGDVMPWLPGGSGRSSRRPCVVVDAIALQRGWAASGETCEIPGVGPVEVAWARRLMGDGVFDVVVHIVDFEPGHDTSYANLRQNCGTDHEDKTQGRMHVEGRGDLWWFTPTGDAGGTGAPPQPRTAPVGEHLSRWNLDHLPDELPDERTGWACPSFTWSSDSQRRPPRPDRPAAA